MSTDLTPVQETANFILSFLGGYGNLVFLTGANNFSVEETPKHALNFTLPPFDGDSLYEHRYVQISLNSMDTYDLVIKGWNKEQTNIEVVHRSEGLYNDMLKKCFEEATGLYLTLFPKKKKAP